MRIDRCWKRPSGFGGWTARSIYLVKTSHNRAPTLLDELRWALPLFSCVSFLDMAPFSGRGIHYDAADKLRWPPIAAAALAADCRQQREEQQCRTASVGGRQSCPGGRSTARTE